MSSPAKTTDNAPAVQAPAKKTLRHLIEDMKPEIARALPSHMTPERMARIATTAIKQNPTLGECTPDSFLGALMTAAQLGLEPNTPLGEAYLVPFKNKNKATNRYEMVCTYIQGYRGLVQLAHRSGQVAMVKAQVVYEKDDFDFEEGLDAHLKHKRTRDANPGEVIWVYAMVKLKDGGSNFVVMTVAEVEAIRKRSRASNNGPWVTDWNAMAKKTALKQLSKWMPLSPEFAVASRLDDTIRRDMNTDLVDVVPDYVDGEVISEDAPAAVDQSPGVSFDDEIAQAMATDDPVGFAERYAEESLTGEDAVRYLAAVKAGVDALVPDAPEDPGVLMAGTKELKRLKEIRAAEKYDDDPSWFDYIEAATGARVEKDGDLTLEQATHIIAIFDEDGAK